MKREKSEDQRTIHLPAAQWDYLKRLAKADQRSISMTLTRLLAEHEAGVVLPTLAERPAQPRYATPKGVTRPAPAQPPNRTVVDDSGVLHEPYVD